MRPRWCGRRLSSWPSLAGAVGPHPGRVGHREEEPVAPKPLGGWALVLGLLSWSLVLRRARGTGTLLVTDTIPAAAVPWVVLLCPSGQLPEPPMLLSWSTGTPTPSSNPWWERTPTLPRMEPNSIPSSPGTSLTLGSSALGFVQSFRLLQSSSQPRGFI